MSDIHLVTGGAGFIGSNLVKKLLSEGKKVRVLDNMSTGKEANLFFQVHLEEIEFILGDIRKIGSWMDGVTHVYHLAALGSVPRSLKNPIETESVNVIGTLALLEESVKQKVKSFVFASSSSVYGENELYPRCEDDAACPVSPYAISKLTAENYCLLYNRIHNLPVVALRYFNVFGPKQRKDGEYCAVIPLFIDAVINSRKPMIEGTGCQLRDFTFVDTVVEATYRAGDNEEAVGQIINVASGKELAIMDVLQKIIEISGENLEGIDYKPRRPGDPPRSVADIALMREILEVEPISFELGIEKTIEFYRGYP